MFAKMPARLHKHTYRTDALRFMEYQGIPINTPECVKTGIFKQSLVKLIIFLRSAFLLCTWMLLTKRLTVTEAEGRRL